MKVAIYGIGNFGFALTKHLSETHHRVGRLAIFAYDRDARLVRHLNERRRHLVHHKTKRIRPNVTFVNNARALVDNADVIILAVASEAVVEVAQEVLRHLTRPVLLINTAKALHTKTGKPFSQVLTPMLRQGRHPATFAVLSGGTIASDLFLRQPLGIDIACRQPKQLEFLQRLFSSENLNVYVTRDVTGVEYAGAMKNVVAILAGIIHGLGFSYGSETHFITRASDEIIRFLSRNARIDPRTFSLSSQCWGNDLWMSCTGPTRNREYGILIGKGLTPAQAEARMKRARKNIEGLKTIRSFAHIAELKKYPILNGIRDIIVGQKPPMRIIRALMRSNSI